MTTTTTDTAAPVASETPAPKKRPRCASPDCLRRVRTNTYGPYCSALCMRTETTWGE